MFSLSIGSSTLPKLTSISLSSTSTLLRWSFATDNTSSLSYQVLIRNTFGVLLYNESQSEAQLAYTIPNPCDRYDAAVTAVYGYQNFTCVQNVSTQIIGGKNK